MASIGCTEYGAATKSNCVCCYGLSVSMFRDREVTFTNEGRSVCHTGLGPSCCIPEDLHILPQLQESSVCKDLRGL